MAPDQIKTALESHKLWLAGKEGEKADLRNADLQYANLRNADLQYANLRNANLRNANLRNADLIVLHLPIWTAFVHREAVRIGCQHHTHDEWRGFGDDQINAMDGAALQWWTTHKALIFAAMEAVVSQPAPESKEVDQ